MRGKAEQALYVNCCSRRLDGRVFGSAGIDIAMHYRSGLAVRFLRCVRCEVKPHPSGQGPLLERDGGCCALAANFVSGLRIPLVERGF